MCSEGAVRIVGTPSFGAGGAGGAGRVEVCRSGVWGTVATQSGSLWSEKNAQVACRQAGFSGVLNSVFITQ